MKKVFSVLICMTIIFSGCSQKGNVDLDNTPPQIELPADVMEVGDAFSLTGVVAYSDEPSDIGQEYCYITINEKIEYYYTDIYDEKAKWSSDVFYTKGNDTPILKEYVGREVTVSGVFDSECHGIPYITDITVSQE